MNVRNAGLALAAAAVLTGLLAAGSALFAGASSPGTGPSAPVAEAIPPASQPVPAVVVDNSAPNNPAAETMTETSAAAADAIPSDSQPVPAVDVVNSAPSEPTAKPKVEPVVEYVPGIVTPPGEQAAPDFRGIVQWINSPLLSLAELEGKVVLIDFWTYSCINCQRTLPYVRDWHDKYSGMGLVVVGVHAPEFSFEKDEDNVQEAVAEQGVAWPVAMDNEFRTWRAYENRWWPHKFLIDRDGVIRYHHIGEGTYVETELHIRNLLVEAGQSVTGIAVGDGSAGG